MKRHWLAVALLLVTSIEGYGGIYRSRKIEEILERHLLSSHIALRLGLSMRTYFSCNVRMAESDSAAIYFKVPGVGLNFLFFPERMIAAASFLALT